MELHPFWTIGYLTISILSFNLVMKKYFLASFFSLCYPTFRVPLKLRRCRNVTCASPQALVWAQGDVSMLICWLTLTYGEDPQVARSVMWGHSKASATPQTQATAVLCTEYNVALSPDWWLCQYPIYHSNKESPLGWGTTDSASWSRSFWCAWA